MSWKWQGQFSSNETSIANLALKLNKGLQSFKGVNITFTVSYLQCGTPAFWAAPHTTVCLDFQCYHHHTFGTPFLELGYFFK